MNFVNYFNIVKKILEQQINSNYIFTEDFSKIYNIIYLYRFF